MKASRAQIERALDSAPGDMRLFLLHGPDESQSRELAARLAKAMGAEAERIDLTGAQLKADPARLSDEAAAISLFGGARFVRVEPAGDEAFDAVTALLESPAGGNPVILIAGALRKDSKLLKLALASASTLAFASYAPEGGDVDRLVGTIAREHGLQIEPDVIHLLATSSGGDRALLAREIEKLALFVDAEAGRPATLDRADYDAIAADSNEGDVARLVDFVLSGRTDTIGTELARLAVAGVDGIGLLRPMLRRLALLAELRSGVDAGNSIETVMADGGRGVFWKDKPIVSAQVSRWTSVALAKAIERITAAELAVKASGSAGPVLVNEELLAIARYAYRSR